MQWTVIELIYLAGLVMTFVAFSAVMIFACLQKAQAD